MTKLVLLALLGACDAGVPRSNPEPVKKVVEVPAAPTDAASVVADAAAPTPALAGAYLQMNHFDLPPQAECARTRLVLKLFSKSKTLLDELKENSTCTGACTDKEKREGREQLDELERAIEAGTAIPSQTDYNFTDCLETGLGDVTIFRKIGGRDVALIADRYTGPHDVVDTRYRVALEVCGKIFVSDTFAEVQSHSWRMERLDIKSEGTDEIIVQGVGDTAETTGTLLDLRMPACPGAPLQQSFDIWPIPI
jgi:hypothetical protein